MCEREREREREKRERKERERQTDRQTDRQAEKTESTQAFCCCCVCWCLNVSISWFVSPLFLLQVLCENTQCQDTRVCTAALQNLNSIMSLYYQYMETYMGSALFAITVQAMQSSDDDVALQVK